MSRGIKYTIFLLPLFLLTAYGLSGVYSLQSGQQALILRFGRVSDIVTDPGVQYHLPYPFEKMIRNHVSNVKTVSIWESSSLDQERFTGDENLIVVRAMISFDVKNLTDYIFSTKNVDQFIRSTGQMILGQELAKMTVDDAMTTGKSILRLVMKEKMQEKLDQMKTGVRIISLELTDITPPNSVKSSFKAVSDARVKKQEIIKDAEGYANSTIPEARGKSATILSRAEAVARELIDSAGARADSFDKLLAEYKKNPRVIKNRKYLDTVQHISKRAKINIDTRPGQSIYYINNPGQ